MSTELHTRKIVDELTTLLGVKDKAVASLLGVTPTTLSTNMDKPFTEVRDNKLGKRLLSLLYVVETLTKDKSLSPKVMLHILTTPRYKMGDRTFMDVVSAIHLGNYPNEFLMEIADKAITSLREKYMQNKAPARESIYYAAISN